jgi:sec-independent protein translocase protein TatB
MLPEAGATELIFLAIVALIVVGPKDLPVLLRKVGQFTAKMRGLAAEFRSSFDELARQSELDELRKEVDALRRGDYTQPIRQDIDSHFESLHRELGAPPPAGIGAREGEISPGPDAATPVLTAPEPAAPPPTTLSQAPEAAEPPHEPPPAPKTEPSAEHAG